MLVIQFVIKMKKYYIKSAAEVCAVMTLFFVTALISTLGRKNNE